MCVKVRKFSKYEALNSFYNCHISLQISPSFQLSWLSLGSIASHVTHPRLIKRSTPTQRSTRHSESKTSRDVRSLPRRGSLREARGGTGVLLAGPVHERKTFVLSSLLSSLPTIEGGPRNRARGDRSSKSRNAREKRLHEKAHPSTPPMRTHSARGGFAFRDQYPCHRPWRLSPRVSLVSSVSAISHYIYMYIYISIVFIYVMNISTRRAITRAPSTNAR